jgi:hypothetical protein
MAIKAWMDGDLKLAMRLLQWAEPRDAERTPQGGHQTRQASTPLWRWQMAA